MFFSRVRLNFSPQLMQKFANSIVGGSYQIHQLIWKLFTDSSRHFLYRQEKDSNSGMPIFYLLSEQEPVDKEGLFQVETKLFAPKLQIGDTLGFKLRVNPTVCFGKNRHDVLMHAKKQAELNGITDPFVITQSMNRAALNWLTDPKRCESLGIKFEHAPELVSQEQHVTYKKNAVIKYTSVDYSGQLEITDPAKFLLKLYSGIGKSKAFGCGLFLIRKI